MVMTETMKRLMSTGKTAHPANWGVIVELEPHAQIYSARSAHGSAHPYDREVPLIFLGAGIQPASSHAPARTIDIAPTLACLLDLPVPATVDGEVLQEACPAAGRPG